MGSVQFEGDLLPLPGDALGVSPNLYGKDHRDLEKFLEFHFCNAKVAIKYPIYLLNIYPTLCPSGFFPTVVGDLATLSPTEFHGQLRF